MNRLSRASCLLLFVVTGCASEEAATRQAEPPFICTPRRADDELRSWMDDARAIIEIHSPRGIGGATIRPAATTWPDTVCVRLRLQGLEEFEVGNGELTLTSSVQIRDGAARMRGSRRTRAAEAGREVLPGDACWLEVRLRTDDGRAQPTLPLEQGYFEVALPPVLFATGPDSLELVWVDFFR